MTEKTKRRGQSCITMLAVSCAHGKPKILHFIAPCLSALFTYFDHSSGLTVNLQLCRNLITKKEMKVKQTKLGYLAYRVSTNKTHTYKTLNLCA